MGFAEEPLIKYFNYIVLCFSIIFFVKKVNIILAFTNVLAMV